MAYSLSAAAAAEPGPLAAFCPQPASKRLRADRRDGRFHHHSHTHVPLRRRRPARLSVLQNRRIVIIPRIGGAVRGIKRRRPTDRRPSGFGAQGSGHPFEGRCGRWRPESARGGGPSAFWAHSVSKSLAKRPKPRRPACPHRNGSVCCGLLRRVCFVILTTDRPALPKPAGRTPSRQRTRDKLAGTRGSTVVQPTQLSLVAQRAVRPRTTMAGLLTFASAIALSTGIAWPKLSLRPPRPGHPAPLRSRKWW